MLFEHEKQYTLNCKGKILDSRNPLLMGILNITPDSFYDGGKYFSAAKCLKQAEKILYEGAEIIDIGGMSSRPGAKIISTEEEIKRVIPVICDIRKRFPEAILSIDTVHAIVAKEAVEAGASIVNDISGGGIDNNMIRTIGKMNSVPYVLTHIKGVPATMQENPVYENIVTEVTDYFIEKTRICREAGIKDIIIDLGFGFGKSLEDNYTLLKNIHVFSIFNLPILVGISRKSMIYKALNTSPQKSLNGTSALHLYSLLQGANILRVHDVLEANELKKLHFFLKNDKK